MAGSNHSYNKSTSLATDLNIGSVPETGGSSKAFSILTVKADGSTYEVKRGLTGINTITPSFFFNSINIETALADYIPSVPIIYTLLNDGSNSTFNITKNAATLYLVKNNILNSVSNYNIKVGETIALYKDYFNNHYILILDRGKTNGWWSITDTTHTTINPEIVLSNTRTKLSITPDVVIDSEAPDSKTITDVFDIVNNKIKFDSLNDVYHIKLAFKVNPSLNNRNLKIEFESNSNIKYIKHCRLNRGAGNDTNISENIIINVDSDLLNNDGEFYITCDGKIDITDISLFIEKTIKT